uniref:SOCS box domain-containing protein n=1 Tax=Clastoptera arizonana TaxID=38151 RepID=A0A1B6DQ58_9HEMI
MEVIIDVFFDHFFSRLDRGCLIARYKRRQLVDYFSTVIEGCCKADKNCDAQNGCRQAVESALRFHENTREGNSQVCLLGKYHNVLYVAAKLAYDWKLVDNDTVAKLLDDIFKCENTFERLFVGAIFGTRVTHLISGWKSDFQNREENYQALRYFIEHATKADLWYEVDGARRRFVDVPMESYGNVSPLRVAVQACQLDVVLLLLQYGAIITFDPEDPHTCALQPLLHRVNDFCYKHPDQEIPQPFVSCLNALLREMPSLPPLVTDPFDLQTESSEVHPNILAVVAPDKVGLRAQDLKDVCRCAVRQCLRLDGQLPLGIDRLILPNILKKYLDFIEQ